MSWNIVLTAAGALMGLAGVALSGHEPQFDYDLAAPVGQAQILPAAYQASPRVSVHFHQAPVGDVLYWLDKQGVSFIVSDSKIKGREITLSIQNQPLDLVTDAIAHALGGHWDRQGAIRVYHDGLGNEFGSFSLPQMKMLDGATPPNADWYKSLPDMPALKDYQFKFDDNRAKDFLKLKDDLDKAQSDQKKGLQLFMKDKDLQQFRFGQTEGFDAFAKSLTDKQRELMKSQGYLKLGDLTDEQRANLGIAGNPEHLEIQYTKDGQTIIIRSK